MIQDDDKNILSAFNTKKIIFPVIIGLGVVVYFIYDDFNTETLSFFTWSVQAIIFLFFAFCMMVVRDVSYMYRIKVLTDHTLTWRKSFDVIILWEFFSAISPTMVGGVAPAIFVLYKEGLNTGKSTAIILVSILLDELFFIVMLPLLFFIVGYEFLFKIEILNVYVFRYGLWYLLLGGYAISLIYSLMLMYALFINPHTVKNILSVVFLIPGLRKWRLRVRKSANQMIIASRELRNKTFGYWFKAVIATFASWTGRFWVTNFMFMAFFMSYLNFFEHLVVYARQLIMRMLLIVSPTPGASGIAEYIFSNFLGDLIPNLAWAIPLALLWRLITYYPYLILGAIVLPNWVKRVFSK